ncbi:hypothetical protein CAEBREN_07906 [Caenorhabditis brenneri]|uniref:Transmembrane protein n=1 Tax=Caenorhabditis brenneri TaxID=135651 RepID=G0MH45_CAEBE|nr:hypothetical protein CAEBREN_07906 [Caenorhabditis brenneri]
MRLFLHWAAFVAYRTKPICKDRIRFQLNSCTSKPFFHIVMPMCFPLHKHKRSRDVGTQTETRKKEGTIPLTASFMKRWKEHRKNRDQEIRMKRLPRSRRYCDCICRVIVWLLFIVFVVFAVHIIVKISYVSYNHMRKFRPFKDEH